MVHFIPLICILFPIAVIWAHYRFPNNAVTRFLIPRIIDPGGHPKLEFLQAGIGWIIFSLWLWTATFVIIGVIAKAFDKENEFIMGLFFVISILALMGLAIGAYYLCVGAFSRRALIKSSFKSMYVKEPIQLEIAINRLKKYSIVNISSAIIFLSNVFIWSSLSEVLQEYFAFLGFITFWTYVITSGKVYDYVIRSATALGEAAEHILKSIKDNPLYSLVAWIFLMDILKLYRQTKARHTEKIVSRSF